jgi:hypothetical protein
MAARVGGRGTEEAGEEEAVSNKRASPGPCAGIIDDLVALDLLQRLRYRGYSPDDAAAGMRHLAVRDRLADAAVHVGEWTIETLRYPPQGPSLCTVYYRDDLVAEAVRGGILAGLKPDWQLTRHGRRGIPVDAWEALPDDFKEAFLEALPKKARGARQASRGHAPKPLRKRRKKAKP